MSGLNWFGGELRVWQRTDEGRKLTEVAHVKEPGLTLEAAQRIMDESYNDPSYEAIYQPHSLSMRGEKPCNKT